MSETERYCAPAPTHTPLPGAIVVFVMQNGEAFPNNVTVSELLVVLETVYDVELTPIEGKCEQGAMLWIFQASTHQETELIPWDTPIKFKKLKLQRAKRPEPEPENVISFSRVNGMAFPLSFEPAQIIDIANRMHMVHYIEKKDECKASATEWTFFFEGEDGDDGPGFVRGETFMCQRMELKCVRIGLAGNANLFEDMDEMFPFVPANVDSQFGLFE